MRQVTALSHEGLEKYGTRKIERFRALGGQDFGCAFGWLRDDEMAPLFNVKFEDREGGEGGKEGMVAMTIYTAFVYVDQPKTSVL
jgi:hypothetical protein